MNIYPLENRVLVRRSQVQTTKNGLIIPETAKEKPKEGEVIAVGPGKTNERGESIPMKIAVGDRVIFGAYAGVPIKRPDDEHEYLIMTKDEILAIVKD